MDASEECLVADHGEIIEAYLKVAYTLDPIQLLISYAYIFTDISLEDLADRVYRDDPNWGLPARVSKQSIHQYIIRPIYEKIEIELEELRMARKIANLKKQQSYDHKYLLALDGATITSGYTVFKDNEIIDNGIIRAKASMTTPDRIAVMQQSVKQIIEKHREGMISRSIMFVVMEDYFGRATPTGMGSVFAVRGAIYSLLNTFPKLVFLKEVNPKHWKAMYGNANEKKEVIVKQIIRYLVTKRDMDEEYLMGVPSDAIESAAIGLYILKNDKNYRGIPVVGKKL